MATLAERREARELVRHPGKFEGEPPITPILWAASLDGTDEEVGSEDEHGWYARLGRYVLATDSQGFVYSRRFRTRAEAAAFIDGLYNECPECELVAWADSHPCRFELACSCWRGEPCGAAEE